MYVQKLLEFLSFLPLYISEMFMLRLRAYLDCFALVVFAIGCVACETVSPLFTCIFGDLCFDLVGVSVDGVIYPEETLFH